MLKRILKDAGIVILAAGKGTRLDCVDKPKVMLEIGGRPIVSYIVETLKNMGFNQKQICLVVGFQKKKVKDYFQDQVSYVDQNEQLGTAHAAYLGIKNLSENIKQVLVLGGDDSAFYKKETLENFISNHLKNNCILSLLTAELDNPVGVGRIIRRSDGQVEIVEKEYLTEEQKKIKEISTGTFCFNRQWFEEIFPRMPKLRKLGEYGLPTALAMARNQGFKYQVVKLKDNSEWLGVNTMAELERADKLKLDVWIINDN